MTAATVLGAHLQWHTYDDGTTFAIAYCPECNIALNSGHHYAEDVAHFGEDVAHFGEALCVEHNEHVHPTTDCDQCHKVVPYDDIQTCRSGDGSYCPDCHPRAVGDHTECYA